MDFAVRNPRLVRLPIEMTVEEFKNQVFPFKDKLFRISYRLLGNIMDAEDAVQDVYLKLWNQREQIAQYRSVEAFCVTLTRNHCLDRIKTHKRSDDQLVNLPSQEKDSPSTRLEREETMNMISLAMAKLPENQKTIMHLRDVEGMSYDEIAGILSQSLNTIQVNLSRARKKVREELIKLSHYDIAKN